jgi:hypothetical protein
MPDHEDLIRQRAYQLWKRSGREGSPEEHWLQAERETRRDQSERVALHLRQVLGKLGETARNKEL